jgi:hypothetical protein
MGSAEHAGTPPRAAWRAGSLVAAVLGAALVVVAVVTRRRAGPRPAGPSLGSPGGTPPPVEGRRSANGSDVVAGSGDDASPAAGRPEGVTARVLAAVPAVATPPAGPASDARDPAPAAGARSPARDAAPGEPGSAGEPGSGNATAAQADAGMPAPTGGRAQPGGAGGRGRRRAVAAGLVVAVLAAAAVVTVVAAGGDGGPDAVTGAGEVEPTAGPATSTPTTALLTPQQAFAQGGDRLVAAGSFTYSGTVHATDVSRARPGLWLAVDAMMVGEVSLSSSRWHETAVALGGTAAETVVDGATVWGRSASDRDALAAQAYQQVSELTGPDPAHVGAALVPDWLAAATDHRDAGTDAQGRRTFRATLPAAALGEVEGGQPAVDAEILLAVDADGAPAQVQVATAPAGPVLQLTLELSRLGEPVAIDAPEGAAAP